MNQKKDSFMMEIKREPLKLDINVDSFYVYVHVDDEYEFELTNESQFDEFVELWENTSDNGDDFEFDTDVEVSIYDQFDNKCYFAYTADHEVGYPSRTPIKVKNNTNDEIGLSEEDIEKIITQVHNNFLEGDYAADEVAEELYDYCS